jgi:Ca2+-transporting ATPase
VLLPLTAVQLLWVNVVADGLPALALALDRTPGLMTRPPRPPRQGLLDHPSVRYVMACGLIKATVGVGLWVGLPTVGVGAEATRTTLFVYESMAQIVLAYPARRVGGAAPLPNVWLDVAVAGGLALQALTVVAPPLRAMLGLVPLDVALFVLVLALLAATRATAAHLADRSVHW